MNKLISVQLLLYSDSICSIILSLAHYFSSHNSQTFREKAGQASVGCDGNRGGCASSQSSGSPLELGNLKLSKRSTGVGREILYLCTVEIKRSACVVPSSIAPPLCRPYFRLRV